MEWAFQAVTTSHNESQRVTNSHKSAPGLNASAIRGTQIVTKSHQAKMPAYSWGHKQSQMKARIKPKITNGTAGLSKMSRGKNITRTEPQNCFQTFFPSLKGTVGEKKLEMKIAIFSA